MRLLNNLAISLTQMHGMRTDNSVQLQRERFDKVMMAEVLRNNLMCSEYCYKADVDFREYKLKNGPIVKSILRAIIAQMNTSGGIVSINGIDHVNDTVLDNWKQTLLEQLKSALPPICYLYCIRLHDQVHTNIPFVDPIQIVHIISKRCARLVTEDYGMYTRAGVGNEPINDITCAAALVSQSSMETDPLNLPLPLRYDDQMPFNEDMNIEFKFWKVNAFGGLKKRLEEDRTQRALLALPNLSSGGYFIIGVDEDVISGQLTIKGHKLELEREDELINVISTILTADSKTHNPRIWGSEGQTPIRGIHWDIEFHPVLASPKNGRRVLIVIRFDHCPGGVFMKKPKSYVMSVEGEVQEMSFQQWKVRISKCTDIPCMREQPKETKSFSLYSRASESSTLPGRSETSSITTADHNREDKKRLEPADASNRTQPEVHSATLSLGNKRTLSWSKDNRKWKQHVLVANKTSNNISGLAEIISSSNPMKFIPSQDTIKYCNPKYTNQLERCMKGIITYHNNKGCVIASKNWIRNIWSSNLDEPPGHVIDFFSMDEFCKMRIVGVFANRDDGDAQFSYVRKMASLTKYFVLTHDNCVLHHGQSIYIEAEVFVIDEPSPTSPSFLDNICRRYLYCGRYVWNSIYTSLGLLILNKRTSLRRSLGDNKLIELTSNQMEVLLGTDISQFNLIEGPPGSGKTILALYLYRQFDPNQCLFLCNNPCLKAYVEFQGVCRTALVQTEQQLHSSITQFDDMKCVIIDDCHNIDCEIGTWLSLFEKIREQSEMYLFIFMDSTFQNFQQQVKVSVKDAFYQFTRDRTVSFQDKTLTEVHRNTQKVVSYISAGFDRIVKCGHDEEGDDVEMKSVVNLRSLSSENGLLLIVKTLIELDRYEGGDIAVLVDGHNHQSDVTLFRKVLDEHLPYIKTQAADKFPVDKIVVDHLDHFAGLDAKVCIFVAPDAHTNLEELTDQHRVFTNPKYKAFAASRGIYRVIFVTDSAIDFDRVGDMYIDKRALVEQIRSVAPDYSSVTCSLMYKGQDGKDFVPGDVGVCPVTGNIFVTDADHDKIHCLDPALRLITVHGQRGSKSGQYDGPQGVTINNIGQVHISDTDNHRVQVITIQGDHVRNLEQLGDFGYVYGIATDNDNRLYVCDRFNQRIRVLRSDGSYITDFTLPRAAPDDDLPRPSCIAVSAGQVAVTDLNGDLYIMTCDGSIIHTLRHDPLVKSADTSHHTPDPGKFGEARGVAFDHHGNIIVADSRSNYIHVLRSDDEYSKGWLVGERTGHTPEYLQTPCGVALTADGHILVCDKGSHMVKLFKVSKLV